MKWHDRQAEQRRKQLEAAKNPKSSIKRPVKKPTKAQLATDGAVKPRPPADPFEDMHKAISKLVQTTPGISSAVSAGSSLTQNSLQQAYSQLAQQQMLQGLQQQQNQLGMRGQIINVPSTQAIKPRQAGKNTMATSKNNPYSNSWRLNQLQYYQLATGGAFGTGGAPSSDPQGDPKFKQGDRVIVGNGKVVHIVKNVQWDGYRYVCSIVSSKGGTARKETEDTLKPAPKEKVKVSFDTVILEDAKKQAILDTMKGVENHELIFTHWGFEDVMEKGRATSFLFYGVPGTGKTLMAQAIADHLGQELLIIGSAEIESSEPGGAERAIKSYFQTKGKVLLFDECDSLVYERSAVGSILGAQVNALLTSLENYEGTVIFTTNRLGVLDEAFNRRLSLKVEFEMPDKDHRIKIWQRMFPKKAPLDKDINWSRLADVEVTGGYIKNAVLRSARIAAGRGLKTITEAVIVEALRDEIKSMIDFEEAKRTAYHVPRQGGLSMTRGRDITKQIGGM